MSKSGGPTGRRIIAIAPAFKQQLNIRRENMPLWKVYHPVGAYTAEDKKALAQRITSVYASVPIPKFYAVVIFEEVPAGSCFVGGELHDKFVRFKIDQIARTIPGPILREWWMKTLDEIIAPWVKDRGYDWEISIDEPPPPFESVGEKRWVEENKASPYTLAEKLPVSFVLAPGIAHR
jgi:phenylpyruvate tautomerase PptA (4-oxalocrotonate tautomerase family)